MVFVFVFFFCFFPPFKFPLPTLRATCHSITSSNLYSSRAFYNKSRRLVGVCVCNFSERFGVLLFIAVWFSPSLPMYCLTAKTVAIIYVIALGRDLSWLMPLPELALRLTSPGGLVRDRFLQWLIGISSTLLYLALYWVISSYLSILATCPYLCFSGTTAGRCSVANLTSRLSRELIVGPRLMRVCGLFCFLLAIFIVDVVNKHWHYLFAFSAHQWIYLCFRCAASWV